MTVFTTCIDKFSYFLPEPWLCHQKMLARYDSSYCCNRIWYYSPSLSRDRGASLYGVDIKSDHTRHVHLSIITRNVLVWQFLNTCAWYNCYKVGDFLPINKTLLLLPILFTPFRCLINMFPFILPGDTHTVPAGHNIELECEAAGPTPPLIHWLFNGVHINQVKNLFVAFLVFYFKGG